MQVRVLIAQLRGVWRSWAEWRAQLERRKVLHAALARGKSGVAYRAWFADPGRLDRLAGPVASYAWSIDADALLVAPGVDDPEPHLVLSPLASEQIQEFRRRFSPTRDRVSWIAPR